MKGLLNSNPHLKYVNGRDHGFTILELSMGKAVAKWFYTSNIKSEKAEIKLAHAQTFEANRHK